MLKFFKIIPKLALVFPFFLVACGSSDSTSPKPKLIKTQPGIRLPAKFTLEDPECLERNDTVKINTIHFDQWQSEDVVPVVETGVNLTSERTTLKSEAISETTYLDAWIKQCDGANPAEFGCKPLKGGSKNWIFNAEESKGPLRLCKDDHKYGRKTYERMAVSSALFTNRAHAMLKKASPARDIPKISLSISPLFINEYVFAKENEILNQREYMTHNMAYFPATSSNPRATIAVFPEDAEIDSKIPGYFWESSFTLAHEFGHHVDLSSNAGFYQTLGLVWNSQRHLFESTRDINSQGLAGGSSVNDRIHSGAQEAFADLLAVYVDNGNTDHYSQIPCLGPNRDVNKSYFSNNDAKELTEDRFSILIGEVANTNVGCDPQYDDPHILGAIIANTANDFFARLTAENEEIVGTEKDYLQRYKLALIWMKHFKNESLNLSLITTNADRLRPLSKAFEKTTEEWLQGFPLNDSNLEPQLKEDLCKIYSERMDATPEVPWFGENSTCT